MWTQVSAAIPFQWGAVAAVGSIAGKALGAAALSMWLGCIYISRRLRIVAAVAASIAGFAVGSMWLVLATAAGQMWIDFIREDKQQRRFMAAGFRPGTDIGLNDPASKITAEFELTPDQPRWC